MIPFAVVLANHSNSTVKFSGRPRLPLEVWQSAEDGSLRLVSVALPLKHMHPVPRKTAHPMCSMKAQVPWIEHLQ